MGWQAKLNLENIVTKMVDVQLAADSFERTVTPGSNCWCRLPTDFNRKNEFDLD